MDPTARVTIDDLDARIERHLIGDPGAPRQRLIGIEYERLLLHRVTGESAALDAAQRLLEGVGVATGGRPIVEDGILKGVHAEAFEVSIEPGGQVEISTPPCHSLTDADRSIAAADDALATALSGTDLELVALGHAPRTPVLAHGLLPRNRYRIMDARMPPRGELTRNMMRATAGFQVTLDFDGRAGASELLASFYRLSPLLAALTANSRIVVGDDSGYATFRHHVWLHTDRDRSALPDDCLDPARVIDGYVAWARRARTLFQWREGVIVEAPEMPFQELVARSVVTSADLALHLSSLFPFVRPRGHAEVRCMDSVPWDRARAIAAMLAAVAYHDGSRRVADRIGAALIVTDPVELRAFHEQVARHGLRAVAPDGRELAAIAREWVEGVDAALATSAFPMVERHDLLPLRDPEAMSA
ncbi:MAG: glutamate-cysteine ligase family protein [Planctomycetota bacterium]